MSLGYSYNYCVSCCGVFQHLLFFCLCSEVLLQYLIYFQYFFSSFVLVACLAKYWPFIIARQ